MDYLTRARYAVTSRDWYKFEKSLEAAGIDMETLRHFILGVIYADFNELLPEKPLKEVGE